MANVKINELPSGRFRAQVFDFTDSDGKRHYKSITENTKSEVKKSIAVFLAKRDEHKQSVDNITVGEAMDKYISSKSNVLSPSTIRGYKQIRNTYFKQIINTKLCRLNESDVQETINTESENHSPKTVRNIYGLLTSTLSVYLPSMTLKTTLPQKVKPDINIPSYDEIERIFAAVEGTDIMIPVYLAAVCGMRRSEISALQWRDVDIDKATISIHAAKVLNAEKRFVIKSTKTVAGKRTIRVFDVALNVLKQFKEARSDSDGESYVVDINPAMITDHFSNMLAHEKIKHYRFHDLRHYAVSVMLSLNMPKSYIADYMGHETEKMIDDVYGHIMSNSKQKFEDNVNDYYIKIFKQNATQNATRKNQIGSHC